MYKAEPDTLQLHYYLENNSHFMNAVILNRAEKFAIHLK